MGCCLSSPAGDRRNYQPESESLKLHGSNRAPPPVEEETVKEVLSETPNFNKPPISPPPVEEIKLNKTKNTHIDPALFCDDEKMKSVSDEEKIVSEKESSELCSLSISETVSASTTTFDHGFNDDEGEAEVKQRVKRSPAAKIPARNRSISGDFGQRRDRVVGKSPSRRTEQLPGKINVGRGGGGGSVKLVQGRELSSGAYQAGRFRPEPYRKDPGEGSGRRSRSPAINRSTMGRSPSARRINGSPGRVRSDPPANKSPGSSNTPNESLENPLVSLECFIFL